MGTIGLLNRWIIVISTAKRLRPKAQGCRFGLPWERAGIDYQPQRGCASKRCGNFKTLIDLSKKLGRNRVAVDVQFPVYPGWPKAATLGFDT